MDRFAGIDGLMDRVARDNVVPAISAGAVVDGKVEFLGAHGFRDLERRLPMTVDTPSRWYSISKPLTALLLARRVAAGTLKWDDIASKLSGDVRFSDPVVTDRATVGDCLLHRTGLPAGDWTWCGASSDAGLLLRRMSHMPCRAGFRAGFHYQNLHFVALESVLRGIGGDWHREMRELLAPLGVHPLTRQDEFIASDRALPYGPNGFVPARIMRDHDFSGTSPASSVCGSVRELAQVARMAALGGTVDGIGILPPKSWNEAVAPVLALPEPEWPELRHCSAAFCGRVAVYRGEILLMWAGGFSGYVAHIAALPGRKAAACAMANRGASPAAELMAMSLLDRAAGWDPLPWADRFLQQKRRFREKGENKIKARSERPRAAWPFDRAGAKGTFEHPAYGSLKVEEHSDRTMMEFRGVSLELVPREGGVFSADGGTDDYAELCWDLRPEVERGFVAAWMFNPDSSSNPLRFQRMK